MISRASHLWAECLRRPEADGPRDDLAAAAGAAGLTGLADALRGPAGRVFVEAAAGDFVLGLFGLPEDDRAAAVKAHLGGAACDLLTDPLVLAVPPRPGAWQLTDFDVVVTRLADDGCHVDLAFWARAGAARLRAVGTAVIDRAGRPLIEVTGAEPDEPDAAGDPAGG